MAKTYKFREILKIIQNDGWYLTRQKGSHQQYKHPNKKGLVTIAGKPNDDIPQGTLNSILKQAKIDLDDTIE
ncbi:type II toxin-antitoxin system HicA family toxin [Raineya sp.]|jgi:predicted RNA binding protein YcfA (HicA-like mRNA interferase family)